MLDKLFKKQTEIKYVVKDTMLEKQNKIINKLIRISLDNTNIIKAAQKMILLIEDEYKIKNCSLFMDNNNKLEYLATDILKDYREAVKAYVNGVDTAENDVFILDSLNGSYLSYESAKQRKIVYSVIINLKKKNEKLGAIYIELDVKRDVEIFEQEMFKTIMESMTIAIENLLLRDKLINLSRMDQLTKMYNRTYLSEYVEEINGKNFSVAMIDIDFFKKINDKYGHMCGDDVLKCIADKIKKQIDSNGEVFRVGGEEFLVISSDSKEILKNTIEYIRNEIEECEIKSYGKQIKVTISAGIADCFDGIGFEDTQNKADEALYSAKENGRNKINMYVGGSIDC